MEATKLLDAKGLACPMPIVKTKRAIGELETGQILEVNTTDKGAKMIYQLGQNQAAMNY